jgi:hypothetical protein
MANTVIQLKYSNVTGTPPSLNLAEPAYSNVSNKLWINDGDAVVAIGGKFYTDLLDAGTQLATQNTFVRRDTSGNFAANTITVNTLSANTSVIQNGYNLYDFANAAFTQANTAIVAGGTIAGGYANSAYLHANAAYVSQNTTGVYANSAYIKANAAFAHSNLTYDHAEAAFSLANTKFDAAGGTISGDTVVSGNLTVSGTTTYVDTITVNISDNILTLNADLPQGSAPSENAGIEVDRGSSANVQLIWNESTDKWTFTNDGTNYSNIGSAAAEVYANTALQYANSAGSYANSGYTQANTGTTLAQAAFDAANSALGGTATDGWARNTANAASSYANSAYDQANTATQYAQSAGDYANSAYATANTDVTNVSTTAGTYGSASVVPSFRVESNGRISTITTNSIAIDASAITTGTLGVARGGTGNTSFTANHVILGNGTGAMTTVGSSTEGHLLTINASGVPVFQHLNGGSF